MTLRKLNALRRCLRIGTRRTNLSWILSRCKVLNVEIWPVRVESIALSRARCSLGCVSILVGVVGMLLDSLSP